MHRESKKRDTKVAAIDFFCGCGGVSNGLIQAGIKILAGIDNNSDVKYAFEKNNPGASFYHSDIQNVTETLKIIKKVIKNSNQAKMLFAACAPCQPFSLQNRNYRNDERKSLMLFFLEIIQRLTRKDQPDYILAENVGPMRKRGEEVIDAVTKSLKDLGYIILEPTVINAADFGVPQNRKRLIFMAAKINRNFCHNKYSWEYFYKHYKEETPFVRDVIGHLEEIPEGLKENRRDPLHISRKLSPLNLKRIKQITKPGGSRSMWNKKDDLECYKTHKGHTDVYGRMAWDKPAPTLTTKCTTLSNGRFGHPEQHRAISLREAAILQTMDDFAFEEPIIMTKVAEQIGNAVPPKLAEKFGRFISELC